MAIKRYIPFLLGAFLAGTLLRSFFNVPDSIIMAGFGLVGGILIIIFIQSKTKSSENSLSLPAKKSELESAGARPHLEFSFLLVWIALLFFLIGIARFSIFENKIAKDELHLHYGETLAVRGTVLSSVLKENSSRIILETDLGRVLIVKRIYPEYKYGDTLKVKGKITEPEITPAFDAKKYLAKDLVYSEMLFPEIKKTDYAPKSKILSSLFLLKNKFETNLKNILPEPHASLADGMLLGNGGVLDKNLLSAFQKTGTIHILVLSGYNITIVGVFIMAVLGYFLPETFAWIGSILGIIAFTLMSGSQSAAVRAAIMALIGLLALRSGRQGVALLSLLWAAFIMAAANPMLLRFDRGFQLSFLATLGLISLSKFLQKKLRFLPEFFGIRETAASSISAQIFVLPLLISWGNTVSVLSPLANVLVLGAVPFIMFFSFLGSLSGFISIYIGQIIAAVSYILISYQIFVVTFLSGVF